MASIRSEVPASWVPLTISACALLVSSLGLFYTARTYAVSHRPYIGVVEIPFQLIESPARALTWKIIVKNVGNIPGFLRIQKTAATLTTSNGIFNLPSLGDVGAVGTFLLPAMTTELLGQYTEIEGPIPMREILDGSAVLNLTVKLVYDSPSWIWSDRHEYSASIRFHVVKGFVPGFVMVNALAD